MSGADSLRGYLLQTIICLLDAFESDRENWLSVVLEPNLLAEKVDIFWRYPQKTKAIQIKSSQNQFGKRQVLYWARELQNVIVADEYELRLLGPCSQSVVELRQVDKVIIPSPKNIDFQGLIDQAAHKLDHFFAKKQVEKILPEERELIIAGLITKLEKYSTLSFEISYENFDHFVLNWHSLFRHRNEKEEYEFKAFLQERNYKEFAKQLNITVERLRDILETLDARYRKVLELDNGLSFGGQKRTLEEIADEFGVSTFRIEELKMEGAEALKQVLSKQEHKLFAY